MSELASCDLQIAFVLAICPKVKRHHVSALTAFSADTDLASYVLDPTGTLI